jgi:hypothetical protein
MLADTSPPNWVVLIHQLPPKPAYVRVKVRRRLLRIGAVALKNTVYVLPDSEDAREDFRWLRREIVADGGEAMILIAGFLEGVTRASIERLARAERDQEYRDLVITADGLTSPGSADIERLQRQLSAIVRRDHFGAAERDAAEFSLRNLETIMKPSVQVGDRVKPHGATWVTRRGIKVDRMACAWLIRGWVDPEATFRFVPADGHEPQPGELRFDMFEGEFTHVGDRCSFEVLLDHFGLTEPALRAVAEIVHDIDCKDGKFGRAEADGVAALVDGIALTATDDEQRLEAGSRLFGTLYASLARDGV